MQFGHVVFETRERTDKQTDGHTDTKIAILRTPPGDEVTSRLSISDAVSCLAVPSRYLRVLYEILENFISEGPQNKTGVIIAPVRQHPQ